LVRNGFLWRISMKDIILFYRSSWKLVCTVRTWLFVGNDPWDFFQRSVFNICPKETRSRICSKRNIFANLSNRSVWIISHKSIVFENLVEMDYLRKFIKNGEFWWISPQLIFLKNFSETYRILQFYGNDWFLRTSLIHVRNAEFLSTAPKNIVL